MSLGCAGSRGPEWTGKLDAGTVWHNDYLKTSDHEYELHFKLRTPCQLKLSGLNNKPGDRLRVIELKSMRISQRSDKESGVFSVTISKLNEGIELLVHEFSVGEWIDAVAFRSHLQQLMKSCVDESKK